MPRSSDPRSQLPGVDRLLENPRLAELRKLVSTPNLTRVLREILSECRRDLEKDKSVPADEILVERAVIRIEATMHAGPRRVINATGVILHTGLGRAPLSDAARKAVAEAAGYCDLEFDLDSGARGDRQDHVERLLCCATGAESALVVNNNAAALYLVLAVLGFRKEVIVSRGQLIEIGGSFRLPEIMARSGCKLVEVGTTNRTRISDFASAVTDKSAMLLRAYPSNYRIDGFTESVEISELADVARKNNLICVDDLGGGLLWDWTSWGLPEEPNVEQSLRGGADLVLVSGDKVIGGPQAGLILGKASLVAKLKKSPLARVLRPGKLEIAALAATVAGFLHHERPPVENLSWQMLTETPEVTRTRAEGLCEKIRSLSDWQILEVIQSPAQAGSGTLPAVGLESSAVKLLPQRHTAASWAKRLRTATIPIVPVVQEGAVLMNMRTVSDNEIPDIVSVIGDLLISRK
ncbi:MAG: L-seryl-tRNA(Sec) selenium transferase [Calditrichaeota bacterium]|nr:L-seryl-tRNA(Sec) selenium transferase [Calditrichota bacterium]MCB9366496.1 L-seryl-tRNA(Sec) selenium transferase [Calditrichota bacterium]MCB9391246.1 L-seryl-tRNA(Sec) selenium transferase [Calditrichota bacterium]